MVMHLISDVLDPTKDLCVGSPADHADQVEVVERDHLGAVLLGGGRGVMVRRGAVLQDAQVAAVAIVIVGRDCNGFHRQFYIIYAPIILLQCLLDVVTMMGAG